jgi:hypothetical protein
MLIFAISHKKSHHATPRVIVDLMSLNVKRLDVLLKITGFAPPPLLEK